MAGTKRDEETPTLPPAMIGQRRGVDQSQQAAMFRSLRPAVQIRAPRRIFKSSLLRQDNRAIPSLMRIIEAVSRVQACFAGVEWHLR